MQAGTTRGAVTQGDVAECGAVRIRIGGSVRIGRDDIGQRPDTLIAADEIGDDARVARAGDDRLGEQPEESQRADRLVRPSCDAENLRRGIPTDDPARDAEGFGHVLTKVDEAKLRVITLQSAQSVSDA